MKMLRQTSIIVLSLLSLATAHFTINYPEMRGDSFAPGASQYVYPCANINQTAATNRTLWPLAGGSVSLSLEHDWSYVFINIGLGTDSPTFNISLTPQLLKETGSGKLCFPALALPSGISVAEGQNASIQVVTGEQSGTALYNCADITFSGEAGLLSGASCTNSSNVAVSVIA